MLKVIRAIFKEPLVHFLLAGAVIFLAQDLAGRTGEDPRDQILLTQGDIEHLAANFTRMRQRPPSPEEIEGLIEDHIREEVYYREAMALGLDKDDTVIRRRLRQKLEFVSEDVNSAPEPAEAELKTYFRENVDRFRAERRYTFSHVYLNPDRHRDDLEAATDKLLGSLPRGQGTDLSGLGDPLMLDPHFRDVSESEIIKQFGAEFAASLGALPDQAWAGPIKSGYGIHFVFVSGRSDAGTPGFEDVRKDVLREWTNARRLAANDQFYQELLSKYEVVIERAATGPKVSRLAEADK